MVIGSLINAIKLKLISLSYKSTQHAYMYVFHKVTLSVYLMKLNSLPNLIVLPWKDYKFIK